MTEEKSQELVLLEQMWGDEHLQSIMLIISEACKHNPNKGHFIQVSMYADHKARRLTVSSRDEENQIEESTLSN